MKKILKWLASALYGLVMIEVLIMISPFAFYWYSLYAPTLQRLHGSPATAWMEAFFLPHSVITTSPVLEFLRWQVGTYAFSIGVLAFILLGLQVYFTKYIRKRVAQSWVYSRIRHPFYLSLAVAAFGLLTMWPRIIILILFLGMMFIYYFLARFEENQMLAKFPEYADYRARTAMFLPGDPGGKLFRMVFGWIPNRRLALAASFAMVTVSVVGGGLLLRRVTIGHSATDLLPEDRVMAIAIWPMPERKIQQVVSIALENPQVRERLARESDAVFTAHLLPEDYGMVSMFADVGTEHRMFTRVSPGRFKYLLSFVFPFFNRGLKNQIMGTPEENFRVVFSRVDEPGAKPMTLAQVTDLSAKMTPIVIADIKAGASGGDPRLERVVVPPRRSLWGDITMPMF